MQDIDAAYLFQDIGDIDDDLSSLLVPDLDFSGINDIYPAAVKKPAPVQTGEGQHLTVLSVKTDGQGDHDGSPQGSPGVFMNSFQCHPLC